MTTPNLIFPIGPGRCGTSLVTGLLAEMGVWVGSHSHRRPDYNPKGFFENFAFKRFIQQLYVDQGMKCVTTEGWQEQTLPYSNDNFVDEMFTAVQQDGYRGGPLALKNPQTAAVLGTLKLNFYDAIFLFVDRDSEETITSFAKKESHVDVSRELIADWVHNANTECRKYATHTIHMDSLMAYNTKVLEDICGNLGIRWDTAKAYDFIEPKYWHGNIRT